MKSIALLVLGLVAALGFAELAVRVAGLGVTTFTRGVLHRFDTEVGWICKPGVDARYARPGSFDVRVRCNSHGLRGPELPRVKAPGVRRIAVLGDSFAWGYGVEEEEMIATRLAEELEGAETFTLGVNGYSTVQALVRLESEGLRYSPDWTVLLFVPNDLEDNFDEKGGGRPVAAWHAEGLRIANRPVRARWKSPGKQWLRHHSRLFGFLELASERIDHSTRGWRHPGADEIPVPERGAGAMEFTVVDVYGEPTPDLERAWRVVEALVARMRDRTREAGGRLLLVLVAVRDAVDAARFAALFEGSEEQVEWDRPARRLVAIAAAQDVPFLDLSPMFRAQPDPDSLFLDRDGHWSARGHALAARGVADAIRAAESADRLGWPVLPVASPAALR